MCHIDQDFEIRVKGHALVKVSDGGVRIDGRDFHNDLRSLNELIDILSGVVESAQEAGRPRLVASSGEPCVILHPVQTKVHPHKLINNA